MTIMSREKIIENLVVFSGVVVFTKNDGTERTMFCTLREDLIPENKKNEAFERKKKEHLVTVWDLEKSDWRAFRMDSIKSVDFFYDGA